MSQFSAQGQTRVFETGFNTGATANAHMNAMIKVCMYTYRPAATWTTAVTQLSDTKDNAPDKTTPEATHATETRLHNIKVETKYASAKINDTV
jgi:hypothetical protein